MHVVSSSSRPLDSPSTTREGEAHHPASPAAPTVSHPVATTPLKQGEPSPTEFKHDSVESWGTNASFVPYYKASLGSSSRTNLQLPAPSTDLDATVAGLPNTRGVVAMFVEVFDDHAVCNVVLNLLHQPQFGAAVEAAYLRSLRARGAPTAVLKQAAALARCVLRDDPDYEELQLLLLAPRQASKAEQLAWCAPPYAPNIPQPHGE